MKIDAKECLQKHDGPSKQGCAEAQYRKLEWREDIKYDKFSLKIIYHLVQDHYQITKYVCYISSISQVV